MTFPFSPIDFPEFFPDRRNERMMAEAISELSRFRIRRAFWPIRTETANYEIEPEYDRIVLVDASGGAVTITLPLAANADATFYGVKALDVTGGNVIVDGNGAETIDGAANVTLAVQYQSVFVISDGTEWWIL